MSEGVRALMARYVVRRGRLRKDEPFYSGTLVYYDEQVFREGKEWLRAMSLRFGFIFISVVVTAIFIGVVTDDTFPTFLIIVSLSPQVTIMFFVYWGWKMVEYGVCIYEGGVDAPRPNGLRVDRVFIPLEEIGKVKVFWKNYTIKFHHSWIRGFWISKKLLDEKGLRILDKLLQGYTLKQKEVAPKLVLYSPTGRPASEMGRDPQRGK